jgi:hypothetical protein
MLPMLNKLKNYWKFLKTVNFKDTSKNLKKCDVLLFCHDADRGVTLNNKAYSPLIDSVQNKLKIEGYSCQTIAHPFSKLIGNLAYGDTVAINRSYLKALVLDKILKNNNLVKYYEDLFKAANPKIIISIGCNDEFCLAARNLNIYHFELLHGIGYTPMPWDWDKKEKENLPQGILSLDVVSTNTFNELKLKGLDVYQINHPFLSRFNLKNNIELPEEWILKDIDQKYTKTILIALQWGYAPSIDELDIHKGILNNGLFFEEIESIIKETKDSIFWRFRFHPVQYRQQKKYKKLFNIVDNFIKEFKNCEWKESTFLPLPSILGTCDGHITMSSMSSYEAAYLGVRTLALCPTLQKGGIYENMFEDLVKKGYLVKEKPNKVKICNWINALTRLEPLLQFSNQDVIQVLKEKMENK